METQEDYDNLYEIAQEIFCNPLKPKKSVLLEIEEECQNEIKMFDILLILARHGINLLFNKTDPLDLTKNEFDKLNAYFNSFGVIIKFSAESLTDRDFEVNRPDQLKSLIDAGYEFANYKIFFDFV